MDNCPNFNAYKPRYCIEEREMSLFSATKNICYSSAKRALQAQFGSFCLGANILGIALFFDAALNAGARSVSKAFDQVFFGAQGSLSYA